jgi:DNA-binding NarL/FixJ family response regulator
VTVRLPKTIDTLTPREMEVLRLMAQGLGNRDIAAQLHVNERTIKYHVSAILSKFGVSNRTEAVTYAAQQGLITL